MMDPRDMPTAGDYAWQEARNAQAYAEGAAQEDAASREELERQIIVLRGQVAFLTGHVIEVLKGSAVYRSSDMELLEKIKENNW